MHAAGGDRPLSVGAEQEAFAGSIGYLQVFSRVCGFLVPVPRSKDDFPRRGIHAALCAVAAPHSQLCFVSLDLMPSCSAIELDEQHWQ